MEPGRGCIRAISGLLACLLIVLVSAPSRALPGTPATAEATAAETALAVPNDEPPPSEADKSKRGEQPTVTIPRCTHYDLSLTIHPEPVHPLQKLYGGTIQVQCVLTLENRTDAEMESVPFLLYRLLQVERISDDSGNALPFTQTIVSLKDRPRQQVNFVVVSLPSPLGPGDAARLTVRYAGPVCGYPEVMPYVRDHVSPDFTLLRMEVIWFPVIGYPLDGCPPSPADFRLSVAVPAGLVAVASGQLCGTSQEGHLTVYQWCSVSPSLFITVACGPFKEMAPAPGVWLYYFPHHQVEAQVVAKAVKRTCELCTAWLGPLPDAPQKIVENPELTGYEASPGFVFLSPRGFHARGPDDPAAYRAAFRTVGHELAHHWGTPSREAERSDFLNEGITHYVVALLLRQEYGEEAYWEEMESCRARFRDAGEPAMNIPLWQAGRHPEVIDEIARGKGPWLLCVLHHLMGDRFLPALRAFFDRYQAQGAMLEDFQNTMAEFSPLDLSRFFQQWMWGTESSESLARQAPVQEVVAEQAKRYGAAAE